MSKRFRIQLELEVVLPVEHIWPDGDQPAVPTEADVLKLLRKDSVTRTMRDWNLDEDADWVVTEIAG